MKILTLPTTSDLSEASFEAARELLGDDLPLMLVGAAEVIDPMVAWLWDHSRPTSCLVIPEEILKDRSAWALIGYRSAVVSGVPS